MKKFILGGVFAALSVIAPANAQSTFHLNSADFTNGAAIPIVHEGNAFGCTGTNRPLTLSWDGVPQGTHSLALTMVDYSAPKSGGFTHWIVYNIPAGSTHIGPDSLSTVRQGLNDTGQTGYFGPCPPAGSTHYYTLTLYALDTTLKSDHLTLPQLQHAVKSHTLDQAALTGSFSTAA
jgi:Raf kinase inhibitor-like YbhB/YbcL family protein